MGLYDVLGISTLVNISENFYCALFGRLDCLKLILEMIKEQFYIIEI